MDPLAKFLGSQKHIHLLLNRLIPLPGMVDRQINYMDFTIQTNKMRLCSKEGSFPNMDSKWSHSRRQHSMFESGRVSRQILVVITTVPSASVTHQQCCAKCPRQILKHLHQHRNQQAPKAQNKTPKKKKKKAALLGVFSALK